MFAYVGTSIALIMCLGVLLLNIRRLRFKNRVSKTLIFMLLGLVICNAIELLVAFNGSNVIDESTFAFWGASTSALARIYLVALVLLVFFQLRLAVLVTFGVRALSKHMDRLCLGGALLVCLLAQFGFVVNGSSLDDETVLVGLRDFVFWLIPFFLFVAFISSASILLVGYRRNTNQFLKVQAVYVLFLIGIISMPVLSATFRSLRDMTPNSMMLLPIVTLFFCPCFPIW